MPTEYLREQERLDAELRERKQRLYDKLNSQPVHEVTGIVGPGGVGGSKGRGEELWTLLFSLVSWRDHQGILHPDQLTVRTEVDSGELDEFRSQVSDYQVIKLAVRISPIEGFGCLQAVLLNLIEPRAVDPELQAIAAGLQQPVVLQTKKFGKLPLDRGLGWYRGSVRLGFQKLRVALDPDDVNKPEAVVELAERLWASIRDWDRKARECAAAELLTIKNGSWLNEGEAPLTAGQFMKRMKAESITVCEDGSFEFWYADGDLFWGHSIDVRGSFATGFTAAGIQG